LLNKIDLIEPGQIEPLETKLQEINPTAVIVRTERCVIDPELLFGIGSEKKIASAEPGSSFAEATTHKHQAEFESFAFTSAQAFSRDCFEVFVSRLPPSVIRAKGVIRLAEGGQLFNFVAGRWELEAFDAAQTQLVFIGREIAAQRSAIVHALNHCAA